MSTPNRELGDSAERCGEYCVVVIDFEHRFGFGEFRARMKKRQPLAWRARKVVLAMMVRPHHISRLEFHPAAESLVMNKAPSN